MHKETDRKRRRDARSGFRSRPEWSLLLIELTELIGSKKIMAKSRFFSHKRSLCARGILADFLALRARCAKNYITFTARRAI